MGHKRLGTLPDTAPWRKVVALLAEAADAKVVADATMTAAQHGLEAAKRDDGLAHVVWLLSRIAVASREEDFSAALDNIGVNAGPAPTVFDLVGAFADAVDEHFVRVGGRTDFGEMAQMAATESLTSLVHRQAAGLFDVTSEDVQRATCEFSTRSGFATLAYDFFSRLTHRFLTYHLSRETSLHCGPNGRFATPAEHNEFLSQLNVLCRQAAIIVRDFAGGWYSKAKFENGITHREAKRFSDYALTKLRRELAIRGQKDG